MEFSMAALPAPLPWKIIDFFTIIVSNKVCMIRKILKSNNIACKAPGDMFTFPLITKG